MTELEKLRLENRKLREQLEDDRRTFLFLCDDPCSVSDPKHCGPHKQAQRITAVLEEKADDKVGG